MKKPSYPASVEIEKIIADNEQHRQLRAQLDNKNNELKSARSSLRTTLTRFMFVGDDPNRSLNEYIRHYHNEQYNDHAVSAEIEVLRSLENECESLREKVKTSASKLHTRVIEICARVEGVVRDEYEAMIEEVANLLIPWCNGEEGVAKELAASTPKVIAQHNLRMQLYPSMYGEGNFGAPLRYALEIVSAKEAKAK